MVINIIIVIIIVIIINFYNISLKKTIPNYYSNRITTTTTKSTLSLLAGSDSDLSANSLAQSLFLPPTDDATTSARQHDCSTVSI